MKTVVRNSHVFSTSARTQFQALIFIGAPMFLQVFIILSSYKCKLFLNMSYHHRPFIMYKCLQREKRRTRDGYKGKLKEKTQIVKRKEMQVKKILQHGYKRHMYTNDRYITILSLATANFYVYTNVSSLKFKKKKFHYVNL